MTVNCQACGYDQNPNGSEYCEACGSELPQNAATQDFATLVTPTPTSTSTPTSPPLAAPPTAPSVAATNITLVTTATKARLIAKTPNPPITEFSLDGSSVIVGKFDDVPVEIDLENFLGSETVSRSHAEIYQEAGLWKVKDLGSTNGTFLKQLGQTRFGSTITAPETLNSGDEISFGKVRFLFQSP